ncbi:MAG: hypothetical protein ABIH83_04245 [Candidatus Micrarchaeota archaeon]
MPFVTYYLNRRRGIRIATGLVKVPKMRQIGRMLKIEKNFRYTAMLIALKKAKNGMGGAKVLETLERSYTSLKTLRESGLEDNKMEKASLNIFVAAHEAVKKGKIKENPFELDITMEIYKKGKAPKDAPILIESAFC